MAVDMLRALGSLGCVPITAEDASATRGRLLATYKLLPTFEYSDKLRCYVDSLEDLDSTIPAPRPPATKKADVFNLDDYEDVDARAVNTPQKYHRAPMKDLVEYLTAGYEDDMAKIRVIYRWVTNQSVDKLVLKKDPQQTQAVFQLWRIKNKKGNYAQLVSMLCRHADIPCVIVHGTLKGSTYEVGDRIDEDKHYGEWNAVLIDNQWRFINAFWGTCAESAGDPSGITSEPSVANGTDGSNDGDVTNRMTYTCDEHYFLTDPEHFITTHLPSDPEWQLVNNQITMDDFESRAFVKDRYYDLRMKTLSHSKCVVRSDTGEAEIRFHVPKQLSLDIDFQYLLFLLQGDEEIRNDRHVFIHRTNNYETLTIKVRSPNPGAVRFELVGKDTLIRADNYDYDWIAIYKIIFSRGAENCQLYPPLPLIGWGPGRATINAGLAPLSHFSGEIVMDDFGKVEIKFGTANKSRIGGMLYGAVMYSSGETIEELPDQVVHRVENGDIIFNAMTPKKGEYILKLYMRKDGETGKGREVCNYFLISKQRETNGAFPKGFSGRLGPKFPAFVASGLQPSVSSGFLKTDNKEVKLEFRRSEDIEVSVNMSGENVKPAEAGLLIKQKEEKELLTYTVRLPDTGQFGVRVRGTRLEGAIHEPLYDYVIDYRKVKKRTRQEPTIKQEAESYDALDSDPDIPVEEAPEPQSEPDPESEPEPEPQSDPQSEPEFEPKPEVEPKPEPTEDETAPEVLRRRLRMATEEVDEQEMKQVVKDLKALNLPSVQPDIQVAEVELTRVRLRRDLIKAIREKNLAKIKSLLKKIKEAKLDGEFNHEISIAKKIIKRLKKLQRLLHDVLALDQKTLAEIRSYSAPPTVVKTVMKATLLVLGHYQEETRKWKNIQSLLGKTGKDSIKRLIADFRIMDLPLEVAVGARKYLKDISLGQVRMVSAGCATFFIWVDGVLEEIENQAGDEINNIRPKTSRLRKKKFKGFTYLEDL